MILEFKEDFAIFKKGEKTDVTNSITAANLINRGVAKVPSKKTTKKK